MKKGKATNIVFSGGIPTAPDVTHLIEDIGIPDEGSVIEYGRVEELINSVRRAFRFKTVTHAWRKRLEREHGVLLVAVPNVGFKAACPTDRLSVSHSYYKQSIRRAMRCSDIAGTTDRKRLNDDEAHALDHYRRIGGVLKLAANAAAKQLPSGE